MEDQTAKQNQNGNVLFLILIAVALFGALSFVVIQSSRGVTETGKDSAKIQASEILNYVSALQQAVLRMRMIGQVEDENFCFASDSWEAGGEYNYYNHADCTDTKNRVFHPDGGGVSWMAPDPAWMDASLSTSWSYTRWIYTGDIAVENVGTTEPELIAFLGPITKELCIEINENFSLSTTFTTADWVCCGWDLAKVFGISNPRYNHDSTIGDQDSEYAGHTTGCAPNNGTAGRYYFWHVLLER